MSPRPALALGRVPPVDVHEERFGPAIPRVIAKRPLPRAFPDGGPAGLVAEDARGRGDESSFPAKVAISTPGSNNRGPPPRIRSAKARRTMPRRKRGA